jgi:hypothetical protein
MVEPSLRRLSTPKTYSKKKSLSIKSSRRTKTSMLSVSPEVKEPRASLRDSVSSICRKRPIEDGEELVALAHGTLPMFATQLEELVS